MSFSKTHVSRSDEGVQVSFTKADEHQEVQEIPTTPGGFVGLVCQCHNLNWHDPLNNGGI